jgi:hypothetical protein
VRAHDQGFVAAFPSVVYGVICDIPSYGLWWPGIRVDTQGDGLRLGLVAGAAAPARAGGHREGLGLVIALGPPYNGTLEWYLESFEEGTIVNSLMDLELQGGRRRASRALRRMRSSIHLGLVGLKRHLEDGAEEERS